jgi:hypothetical protein
VIDFGPICFFEVHRNTIQRRNQRVTNQVSGLAGRLITLPGPEYG